MFVMMSTAFSDITILHVLLVDEHSVRCITWNCTATKNFRRVFSLYSPMTFDPPSLYLESASALSDYRSHCNSSARK